MFGRRFREAKKLIREFQQTESYLRKVQEALPPRTKRMKGECAQQPFGCCCIHCETRRKLSAAVFGRKRLQREFYGIADGDVLNAEDVVKIQLSWWRRLL